MKQVTQQSTDTSEPVDSDHEGKEWIAESPCPRCGCYLARHFACNCDAVHSDYCVNCGRFTSLGPKEYVDLYAYDALCEHGAAMHQHPYEEKEKRMEALQDKISTEVEKLELREGRRATPAEAKRIVEQFYGIKTEDGERE
jgi:hypothetical protein